MKTRKLQAAYTKSVQRIAGRYERQAGWIGISASQIETGIPDLIYVRFANGQAVKAVNKIAPLIYNYPVTVARGDAQQAWEVVEIRQPYGGTNLQALKDHHLQHEYPSQDTVWIRDAQFIPLLVLPSSGFTVAIYGGVVKQGSGYYAINNQTLDLSSYQPTSGAVWALVEIVNGVVGVSTSAEYASKELLLPDLIPSSNGIALCAIQLYAGQEAIKRDNAINDFVDLRFTGGVGGGANAEAITASTFLLMGA